MKTLALIDYDGTIAYDYGGEYLPSPALLPTVGEGFAILREANVGLAVVTNQPDRAETFGNTATQDALDRGLYPLRGDGEESHPIPLYICSHKRGGGCDCRKPLAGLLRQALSNRSAESVWMIGDKWSDVAAGVGVGANTILVGAPYPYVQSGSTPVSFDTPPDYRVNTFLRAAELVVALSEMWSK